LPHRCKINKIKRADFGRTNVTKGKYFSLFAFKVNNNIKGLLKENILGEAKKKIQVFIFPE